MRKKDLKQSGFTLIEVIISIVVFMITLLGLVSLQRVSMQGATSGKEHTAAVDIAQYTMTWLQNEAAAAQINAVNPSDIPDSTNYPLLSRALNGSTDTWLILESGQDDFRFDTYLGNSEEAHYGSLDSAQFCVYYRVEPFLAGQQSGNNIFLNELYKVRIKVSWPKTKQYNDGWDNCATRLLGNLADYNSTELLGVVSREFSNKL